MAIDSISEDVDLLGNPSLVIEWLERQDEIDQQSQAQKIFDKILGEAAQPKSISGNACVRLCGFIERASKAESKPILKWVFSSGITFKLYDFYIDWNEFDHHRSMRLVLDSIAHLLGRNPEKTSALKIRDALLDNLISIVIGRCVKPVAKSAFKTLDYLFAKGVFDLNHMKSVHISYHQHLAKASDLEVWQTFMNELFSWTRLHLVCPAAGKFIVNLYLSLRKNERLHPVGFDIDTWHKWLITFLVEAPATLENFKNYVFLPLFKADKSEGLQLLRQINNIDLSSAVDEDFNTSALLTLAGLETGKKVGLVEEPDLGADDHGDIEKSTIILQESVLEHVLTHPSHEVRTSALTLLISSPSTTRPYSSTTIDLLKSHLGNFFADPDAKFRVDVCARARDMFKRVRGAISVLKRSIPRAKATARKAASGGLAEASQPILYRANLVSLPAADLVSCLEYHENFLDWYMSFLCTELSPTASYQRHIASLKCLLVILRLEGESSKTWETVDDEALFFDKINSKWMRTLSDLIMDPFDDVRELSFQALARVLADGRYRLFSKSGIETNSELNELLERTNKLSIRTARADHSDGVARASQLVYKFLNGHSLRLKHLSRLVSSLESKILEAESDLGRAVIEQPLHSDFASLCYTWQAVSEQHSSSSELESIEVFQDRLVVCCDRIWRVVRDVLCDDSPEGHLPQEMEDAEGLDTKDLLSYSFRAIHESSTLMKTIALTARNRSREGLISPSRKAFEAIGNLTFEQLASLRHRGAFTTVAATFATCCQLTKYLIESETEQSLLVSWYQGTMNEIFTQASTTRRSAGIPSMITGILTANASHPSFEEIIEKLMEIASIPARVIETDGSNLPQVHAYNCLKDIFKNSLLSSMGNKSEKYLPQCVELAASGLRSEVWAIRNCGLIFLRSLIDTLFGSGESKAMIEAGWDGKANRIPYHRYPNLPNVLATLLKAGQHMVTSSNVTSSAESVFPALDIIRRAGPPELLRDEIQACVATYLSSPVWHVREIAARTLCSCLLNDRWLYIIKDLFQKSFDDRSTNRKNHVHGVLLSLKFVFERLSEVSSHRLCEDIPELANYLEKSQIAMTYIYCPDIVAAYLEIVNLIWRFQISKSQPLHPERAVVAASCGSALLRVQSVLHEIIFTSQQGDFITKIRKLLLGNQIGADTMSAILGILPELWPSTSNSEATQTNLGTLYIDICLKTSFIEAQVVALENLAELIDQVTQGGEGTMPSISQFLALWAFLPQQPLSPALSNAIIRVSGGIMAIMKNSQRLSGPTLRNWGFMMGNAGLDDKSLDTRFSAAQSLVSFFSAISESCSSEDYLPALHAIYDALNDDDEEVREVGSKAAKAILNQNLVPIEAARCLLRWITQHFRTSRDFQYIVARRITGECGISATSLPWVSADRQLTEALKFDSSLFAVEEQNLFVDEVRETERWVAVLEGIDWNGKEAGDVLDHLQDWICAGSECFKRLLNLDDGPLGWASNPHVFAICTRIIRGLVALKNLRNTPELIKVVTETRHLLESSDHDVSRLLTDPLRGI